MKKSQLKVEVEGTSGYRKGAHIYGQLFHRGKLLMEIAALSKMPCLIVDLLRSRVRPLE